MFVNPRRLSAAPAICARGPCPQYKTSGRLALRGQRLRISSGLPEWNVHGAGNMSRVIFVLRTNIEDERRIARGNAFHQRIGRQ